MVKRIILIVLDSVGIGYLPDAHLYNDIGSDTIGNISESVGGLKLKNLSALGLGSIDNVKGIERSKHPIGCFGKAAEMSPGKDTTTGHWEISGLILNKPFPTFPNAFPADLINNIEKAIGTKTIGNEVASGTEIISRLGDEHIKTGFPIVYTSADSVFQVAAHEEIIPLHELYSICELSRKMLKDEYAVGRVIARPFIGNSGNYTRTHNRKDFSLKPFSDTMLDIISKSDMDVIAIGKIEDIFSGQGITKAIHTKNNNDGIRNTIELIKSNNKGIIFTNLVDFDMLYGHRNDVLGYANALLEFDNCLPNIINSMEGEDVLIITADHGCDPTTASTDHSREYIPIMLYSKQLKSDTNIGTRKSFSDIGATILDLLNLPSKICGESFKNLIMKI